MTESSSLPTSRDSRRCTSREAALQLIGRFASRIQPRGTRELLSPCLGPFHFKSRPPTLRFISELLWLRKGASLSAVFVFIHRTSIRPWVSAWALGGGAGETEGAAPAKAVCISAGLRHSGCADDERAAEGFFERGESLSGVRRVVGCDAGPRYAVEALCVVRGKSCAVFGGGCFRRIRGSGVSGEYGCPDG